MRPAIIKMRLRITFSKTEAMRFTGHLDLHKAWERTFRRAGLPLAYSQGFHPQPKINLASALPLGFTGENEILDAVLEEDLPVGEALLALQCAVPPGIEVKALEAIPANAPAPQSELIASEYMITFLEEIPDLAIRLKALQQDEKITAWRRGKSYDLKPLILQISALDRDAAGCQRLFCRLTAQAGATGRPDELLAAMAIDPHTARFHRLGLIFSPKQT